ncbi:MAG: hypothetical protein ABI832_21035 [bacterium]
MLKITLPADRFEPDMSAVAMAFGIGVKDLHDHIETDIISRWFEVGTGDADDKPHQIFASFKLGIRVDTDEHGNVCAVSDYKALAEDVTVDPVSDRKSHIDALLDEAINESFPASDPMAISIPRSLIEPED